MPRIMNAAQAHFDKRTIGVFTNDSDGVEARVYNLGSCGYSVVFRDIDSGIALPTIKKFADRGAALAYAEKVIGCPSP